MEFTQDTLGGMFETAPENNQPVNQQQGDSWQQDLFSNPAQDQDYDPLMPQEQIKPVNNDEVRYQYFQSLADKTRAENEDLKLKMAELEGRLSTVNQPVQQQQPEVQEESFPDFTIPEPQSPMNFNWQEAYTDPNSDSARYLIEKQKYDNQLANYTKLASQYAIAKAQEAEKNAYQKMNEYQTQMAQRMEQEQKLNQVQSELQYKYGLTRDQANDFITKMSDNNIFNLENMVKFYQTISQPQQQQPYGYHQQGQYGQPSQAFNQYQRAQSIPNVMGVTNTQPQAQSPMQNMLRNMIQNSANNMFK